MPICVSTKISITNKIKNIFPFSPTEHLQTDRAVNNMREFIWLGRRSKFD
jgi:hypothetical protein